MTPAVILLLQILGPSAITGGTALLLGLLHHKTTTAVSADHTAQLAAANAAANAALQAIVQSGTVNKASATAAGNAAAGAAVGALLMPAASAAPTLPQHPLLGPGA